jgi:hypothetical protein
MRVCVWWSTENREFESRRCIYQLINNAMKYIQTVFEIDGNKFIHVFSRLRLTCKCVIDFADSAPLCSARVGSVV